MLLYLDDDIGWHFSKTSVKHLSMKVRQDIIASGFTLNDQESVSLGVNSNNNLDVTLNLRKDLFISPSVD